MQAVPDVGARKPNNSLGWTANERPSTDVCRANERSDSWVSLHNDTGRPPEERVDDGPHKYRVGL